MMKGTHVNPLVWPDTHLTTWVRLFFLEPRQTEEIKPTVRESDRTVISCIGRMCGGCCRQNAAYSLTVHFYK